MRGISFVLAAAAAAFMASSAQSASAQTASAQTAATQSASTASLRDECERITRPHEVCVLGRVLDQHTLVALDTTQDLPTDRPAVWASKAAESYRPIPGLERYAGRLVMVAGDWTDGALHHARLLLVPTYSRRGH